MFSADYLHCACKTKSFLPEINQIHQWQAPQTGAQAEKRAFEYLISQHLTHVETNFRCKGGELDLIFKQDELWIFVEVKFRKRDDYGHAAEYVTPTKLQRIMRAINMFFMQRDLNIHHQHIRIDVIAIENDEIQWLKNIN